jgi:hypothetical protein
MTKATLLTRVNPTAAVYSNMANVLISTTTHVKEA